MEWIAACKNLPKKREVLAVARATGKSAKDVASILLFDLWAWADDETIDGLIPGVSVAQLTELGQDSHFWESVAKVGWLKDTPQGLFIPNFTRWMGESAKKRLMNSRRKSVSRSCRAFVPLLSRKKRDHKTRQDKTENSGGESPLTPLPRTQKRETHEEMVLRVCSNGAS